MSALHLHLYCAAGSCVRGPPPAAVITLMMMPRVASCQRPSLPAA
jgi:hypothetical protein